MKLLRLTLSNFKGVKQFILQANGHDAQIYGDNATGKTTLYDAFLWLLFDKDSQNKKDFAIKTLASDGSELHGLEHTVEGSFEIDGRAMTLTKSYMEQWTKKRGSAEKTFTGHTTDYFIDSVPVKKKEYEARIAEIVNENVFRLLTNPAYFNEHLDWQDRRKILLEVCGDITDDMVIASDKSLAALPGILEGRKLDDHKKVIAARRAKINDELKKIPVRIDEVQRSLPDISDGNADILLADMAKLNADIKSKEQELARIETGGEIAEKVVQRKQLEAELIQIKNNCQGKTSQIIAEKTRELNIARAKIADIENSLRHEKKTITESEKILERIAVELASARDRWYQVDARQLSFDPTETCPTCGQHLPQDKINAAREKALADFNQTKSMEIERINSHGQHLDQEKKTLTEEVQSARAAVARLTGELPTYQEKANYLQAMLENLIHDSDIYKEDPAYITKSKEFDSLQQAIDQLRDDNGAAIAAAQAGIRSVNAALQNVLNQLAQYDQAQLGKERIAELSDQERDLAAEYEKLEKELHLTEQFVRTKVAMLEEKINSKFKMARFKLFDVQVNGGISETCETLYKGVPYGSGLNNAARINVGLDIINTLSDHYGFTAPIFVDNREAVTKLIDANTQIIGLIVSEKDKALRVETDTKQQTLFREVV
jgi:DNA repair exonuclease SbcCD ATPase subunit